MLGNGLLAKAHKTSILATGDETLLHIYSGSTD